MIAILRALFYRCPRPRDKYILDDAKQAVPAVVVAVIGRIVRFRYPSIPTLPDGMMSRHAFHFCFKYLPEPQRSEDERGGKP